MIISEISRFDKGQILALYDSVGWTAYTAEPETLLAGLEKSLLVLGAYDGSRLLGLARCVGDGETIVYVQDILVFPEHQRRGLGTALLREMLGRFPQVRQVMLSTDAEERTLEFYSSMGFAELGSLGCRGFMLVK